MDYVNDLYFTEREIQKIIMQATIQLKAFLSLLAQILKAID